MQLNKELLILAGFVALFFIYYGTGWFCDKNFRLVMRKTKLSPARKILYHFRGSKMKDDKGHAMVCLKFERIAFVNIILGAICFAAVKVTGQTLVFLGSGALGAASFAFFVFQMYINIPKYKERKKQLDNMDETGFEDYHVSVQVNASSSEEKQAKQPSVATASKAVITDGRIDSLESGREILKNKGLLDDDIFLPMVADVTDKFTNVKAKMSFSEESDIEIGKAALNDLAGKQLKTEAFRNVNSFDDSVFARRDENVSEESRSVKDIIDNHRDDINPENQFKAVNTYSPVRKDDNK